MLVAAAGILFLTLYPFRVDLHSAAAQIAHPFLLGTAPKRATLKDVFLNIMLFVPFGFGLAEKWSEKGRSSTTALVLTFAAGAVFSYLIEFAQLYIPQRGSGWTDVLTNSSGAAVGFLLFQAVGPFVTRFLSGCERLLETWITARRAALALVIYFAAVFWLSAWMQKQSRLSDWNSRDSLWVQSDTAGGNSAGKVLLIEFWDRAIPDRLAGELTSGHADEASADGLLANYDLSGAPPFADRQGFLPVLSTVSNSTGRAGRSWVVSDGPIDRLVTAVRRSNQFSIRVVCRLPRQLGDSGEPLAILRTPSLADLTLSKEDTDLDFWFRTPISARRSSLSWQIPNELATGATEDILYSYNGSHLVLTINGREIPQDFELTPGTVLAQLIRQVKTTELMGYALVYDSLVFLPVGLLLGTVIRKRPRGFSILGSLAFTVPPLLLEILLSRTIGRPVSVENMVLAAGLTLCGLVWVNADRFRRSPTANITV